MSRYIDAEEIKKVIRKNEWTNPAVLDAVAVIINRMPTADVTPVVHAEWVQDGCMYKCSNCGNLESYYDDCYCRVCGAKMNEEVEQ